MNLDEMKLPNRFVTLTLAVQNSATYFGNANDGMLDVRVRKMLGTVKWMIKEIVE